MAWADADLIVGTDAGEVWKVGAHGGQAKVGDLAGVVIALAAVGDDIYAVGEPSPRRLLRLRLAAAAEPEQLLKFGMLGDIVDVVVDGERLYLADPSKGSVLTLHDSALTEFATGLTTPSSLALADDGTLYVSEFSRGVVLAFCRDVASGSRYHMPLVRSDQLTHPEGYCESRARFGRSGGERRSGRSGAQPAGLAVVTARASQ